MKKIAHSAVLSAYVLIILSTITYLVYTGLSYYSTSFEERFYHPRHEWFKPSGIFGHGLGIIGTLLIIIGVTIYIARKRYNFLAKYIRLKYLLEFHIFLCTLGPILILFHTAFKFGGIVSIAFWSMVAVVLSGVIGRFIYIQIPRTIEGRELSLYEIKNLKTDLSKDLNERFSFDDDTKELIARFTEEQGGTDRKASIGELVKSLKKKNIHKNERAVILKMVRNEKALSGKIARLQTMQKLFKYWHVAHLPFALIMLIIVIIHVGITLAFGYKWIF